VAPEKEEAATLQIKPEEDVPAEENPYIQALKTVGEALEPFRND